MGISPLWGRRQTISWWTEPAHSSTIRKTQNIMWSLVYTPEQYVTSPITRETEATGRHFVCLSSCHICTFVILLRTMGITDRRENVGPLLPPLCIHCLGSAVALETGKTRFGAGREQAGGCWQSFGCPVAHALLCCEWESFEFRLQQWTLNVYEAVLKRYNRELPYLLK